jgi:hypothetical protein
MARRPGLTIRTKVLRHLERASHRAARRRSQPCLCLCLYLSTTAVQLPVHFKSHLTHPSTTQLATKTRERQRATTDKHPPRTCSVLTTRRSTRRSTKFKILSPSRLDFTIPTRHFHRRTATKPTCSERHRIVFEEAKSGRGSSEQRSQPKHPRHQLASHRLRQQRRRRKRRQRRHASPIGRRQHRRPHPVSQRPHDTISNTQAQLF